LRVTLLQMMAWPMMGNYYGGMPMAQVGTPPFPGPMTTHSISLCI
jgi:hypothetical protein